MGVHAESRVEADRYAGSFARLLQRRPVGTNGVGLLHSSSVSRTRFLTRCEQVCALLDM